jgi:SAM-dependent methyltransferase
VLHEIPDQDTALGELRRVLKPGGRLVVGEFSPLLTHRALRARAEAAAFAHDPDGRSACTRRLRPVRRRVAQQAAASRIVVGRALIGPNSCSWYGTDDAEKLSRGPRTTAVVSEVLAVSVLGSATPLSADTGAERAGIGIVQKLGEPTEQWTPCRLAVSRRSRAGEVVSRRH